MKYIMQSEETKIPIRILKTERKLEKKSRIFSVLKSPQLKILACILVIALNWAGFSAVLGTAASFSDTETSIGNLFEVGTLDFNLESPSDFLPACLGEGEPAERTISLKNFGNPFKYMVSSAGFSSELCDWLILEANINGGDPEYLGKLKDFSVGLFEFSDPEDWVFKLTIPLDLPSELQGKTCNFKFVFDGSQTKNDLPFGEGFTDSEEIASSVTAAMCRDAETRTIGYWKTHPEIYEVLLTPPIMLGDEQIVSIADVEKVFADYELSMRNKLRGQLLAMKFNIEAFDIGKYVPEGDSRTLDEIVEEADDLLKDPDATSADLEKMKDLLDTLNNLHEISICPVTCTKNTAADILETEKEIEDLFMGGGSTQENNSGASDKDKNSNFSGNLKKNIIEEEIGITTDTPELAYNASRSARKKVNIVVPGLNILKKKWVKVRMNGKNIPILKVRKRGNDTILQLNLKYKKWAVGKYDLTLSYKNREKQNAKGKNGKVRQKNVWSWKNTIAKELFSII
ncbi:MAG: hypothetical protein A2359_00180 [Candidatus Moranbacteria bacterium RIFOXYB1_FULL_43_19]|nr:MAG: hypothetical protein A2359_00180 [Candidatus Moranbacteria bacterium RIFOXYB1_FULL_43_19]OGI34094.1 MAG: hypothetical protein A2420_00890 [Candidatus Moranbacteria bacterium RIFOXYC1_FULL_44_13]OGI37803.1 MAG: hypothetical protein A2612_04125 [Candidatus Moranbacteria bacterium RIFOXYD1_FULL_44_12]